MEWLNYHHLFYFWVISQEGNLSRAAVRLSLTHSTLSAQLRALEVFLGGQLFDRRGRKLVLTPFGAQVAEYANDIFRLGSEMVDVARGRAAGRRKRFRLGIVGTLPRTIVYRLIEPVLDATKGVAVTVRQAPLDDLLALLTSNRLQLVLSDSPARGGALSRIHTHSLGRTDILLYGDAKLAARYREGFPASLEGAPLIMPSAGTGLRLAMEKWFADRGIAVDVAAELDDAGLLRVFGAFGQGLFPIRSALRSEVEETYNVHEVGAMSGLEEHYYAISLERKITDPFLAQIMSQGRIRLRQVSGKGR
jgi:LysR family transcriptional activator of nhaA